ncbi:MAG: protease inhibitor I42 family protein [Spirochaetales bacterium]|nr:protease inhibitor I42 family protein [Candidatus Physcosoma equi]
MKKIVLFLVLLLAGTLLFASGTQEETWYKVSPLKKTLTVTLSSNPTTGYQWVTSLDILDGANFRSFEEGYRQHTKSNGNMVGGGGTYRVKLKDPISDGTVLVHFNYKRSWESNPPIESKTLRVTIQHKRIVSVTEE